MPSPPARLREMWIFFLPLGGDIKPRTAHSKVKPFLFKLLSPVHRAHGPTKKDYRQWRVRTSVYNPPITAIRDQTPWPANQHPEHSIRDGFAVFLFLLDVRGSSHVTDQPHLLFIGRPSFMDT